MDKVRPLPGRPLLLTGRQMHGGHHDRSQASSPGPGDGLRSLGAPVSQSGRATRTRSGPPGKKAGSGLSQPRYDMGSIQHRPLKELTRLGFREARRASLSWMDLVWFLIITQKSPPDSLELRGTAAPGLKGLLFSLLIQSLFIKSAPLSAVTISL